MADNLASEARTELTALATTYRNQALSEAGAGFGLGGLGAAFPPVAEFAEPLGAAFDAAAFKNEAVSADLKELASNIAAHPGEAQALLNAAASKYETAAHEELGAGILAGRVFPPIGVALGAAALKNDSVARDIDKIAEKTYHPSGDLGHQRVNPVEVIRNADLHHVRGESKDPRLPDLAPISQLLQPHGHSQLHNHSTESQNRDKHTHSVVLTPLSLIHPDGSVGTSKSSDGAMTGGHHPPGDKSRNPQTSKGHELPYLKPVPLVPHADGVSHGKDQKLAPVDDSKVGNAPGQQGHGKASAQHDLHTAGQAHPHAHSAHPHNPAAGSHEHPHGQGDAHQGHAHQEHSPTSPGNAHGAAQAHPHAHSAHPHNHGSGGHQNAQIGYEHHGGGSHPHAAHPAHPHTGHPGAGHDGHQAHPGHPSVHAAHCGATASHPHTSHVAHAGGSAQRSAVHSHAPGAHSHVHAHAAPSHAMHAHPVGHSMHH